VSGTGMGRQLPQPEKGLTPAEQHLGDRLAALIDGELGHDARERVLSHLATCRSCKTEADAQRRVKNVFADTAPPPPSDGLLARLQGLPAGSPDDPRDDDGGDSPRGGSGGGFPQAAPTTPAGGLSASAWAFDYLRGGRATSALSPDRGFRIQDMDRSSRGRRFAFAAAGAVSLAALALGGGLGSGAAGGVPTVAKGDTGGATASSVRTASSASSAERDRRRRDTGSFRSERSGGALSVSTATGNATGAAARPDRDTSFHPGAPWAAPTAPPASQDDVPQTVYPFLRDALFASPLTRSALPSVSDDSYNSYDAESYAGMPVDAFPGSSPMASAPAPSPVVTAAPPQG